MLAQTLKTLRSQLRPLGVTSKSQCARYSRKQGRYLLGDNMGMRGITYDLKKCFWPHFVAPNEKTKSSKRQSAWSRAVAHTISFKAPNPTKKYYRSCFGQKRGKLVGTQIAKWAEKPLKFNIRSKTLHPWTKYFIHWCQSNSMQPVHGELVVADALTGYATGVDLLVTRPLFNRETNEQEDAFELVEIKCGMEGKWMSPAGHMNGRLAALECSFFSQAMVQLAVTAVIFKRYLPHITISSLSICRISDKGVDYHRFDMDYLEAIGLLAYKTLVEKKRAKSFVNISNT